jgi:hypothetical protein
MVYEDLSFSQLEHHLDDIFTSGYSVSIFTDWQNHRATQIWIKRRVDQGSHKGWDVGLFDKRVGTFYQDNGQYHNQAAINPFTLTNVLFNYALRTSGRFDQTKLRLTFNNLFDQHNVTGNAITGTALTQSMAANGTSYTDRFIEPAPHPSVVVTTSAYLRTEHHAFGNLWIGPKAISSCRPQGVPLNASAARRIQSG